MKSSQCDDLLNPEDCCSGQSGTRCQQARHRWFSGDECLVQVSTRLGKLGMLWPLRKCTKTAYRRAMQGLGSSRQNRRRADRERATDDRHAHVRGVS